MLQVVAGIQLHLCLQRLSAVGPIQYQRRHRLLAEHAGVDQPATLPARRRTATHACFDATHTAIGITLGQQLQIVALRFGQRRQREPGQLTLHRRLRQRLIGRQQGGGQRLACGIEHLQIAQVRGTGATVDRRFQHDAISTGLCTGQRQWPLFGVLRAVIGGLHRDGGQQAEHRRQQHPAPHFHCFSSTVGAALGGAGAR